jgi:hypothetical protein
MWTSIKAVAHDTIAQATFATVITTATAFECIENVHRFIKWVAPQRTMKAPNCISTHLYGKNADFCTKYISSMGMEKYAKAIKTSDMY